MTVALFMAMARRAAPRLVLVLAAIACVSITTTRSPTWVAVVALLALLGVGSPLLTFDWWHRVRTGSAPPPRGLLHGSPPGTWHLVLQGAGEKPIQVIKVLRELTGIDLLSAKTAVENPPTEVGSGLSEAAARRGAELLISAGATAVAEPAP